MTARLYLCLCPACGGVSILHIRINIPVCTCSIKSQIYPFLCFRLLLRVVLFLKGSAFGTDSIVFLIIK